ncbi:VCBS repeat-containing protein [Paraferrimonas sp. SM1919]|uniref:FG-GAP repeat domain-containing protein n=1 Tax=Paraferrimonas sp. SM1919 TaxID=2662263 RepID=UPI0013D021DF|nr:VCBS repeat-containing protein [Paraferrimonas sp. SM1919]
MVRYFFIVLLLVGFNACAKLAFDKIVYTSQFELTQPIEAAQLEFNGKAKSLISVGINEQQQYHLLVWQLTKNKLTTVLELPFPDNSFAFDISEHTAYQKAQQVVVQASSGVYVLNYQTKSWLQISNNSGLLAQGGYQGYLAKRELLSDVNDDGIEDVFIQGFNQLEVLIAKKQQYQSMLLPIKSSFNLERGEYQYTPANVYVADMTLDGLSDIIWVTDNGYAIFKQVSFYQFDPEPIIKDFGQIRLSVSQWWQQRDKHGQTPDQSNLKFRRIRALKDMNNDGLVDLLVSYSQSSGVLDRSNDYELYLGMATDMGLSFSKTADTIVKAEGTLQNAFFEDLDKDNKPEVVAIGFDIGLGKIISALLSGSIAQDVHFFKLDNNNQFPKKANVTRQVDLSFSLSSGKSGNPLVKLADVNGDGFKDLLLGDDSEAVDVYFGEGSAALFNKRAASFEVNLPKNSQLVSVADINNDGRDDLLIKFGKQDGQQNLNQIILMIAWSD